MLRQMTKAKLIIEIVVDADKAEELASDFQKLYWNHRISMYGFKSKTENIPVSHCTYCKAPMFEKTSNNLCQDPVCTRLRQDDFNNKKKIYVDRWKEMMCNKCTDNNNKAHCYLNNYLVHASSTCEGCRYDTTFAE